MRCVSYLSGFSKGKQLVLIVATFLSTKMAFGKEKLVPSGQTLYNSIDVCVKQWHCSFDNFSILTSYRTLCIANHKTLRQT